MVTKAEQIRINNRNGGIAERWHQEICPIFDGKVRNKRSDFEGGVDFPNTRNFTPNHLSLKDFKEYDNEEIKTGDSKVRRLQEEDLKKNGGKVIRYRKSWLNGGVTEEQY